MRVTLFVAALALATAGGATAVPALHVDLPTTALPALQAPTLPAVDLEPALPAVPAPAAKVAASRAPATLVADVLERIEAVPTFLLLPDGALEIGVANDARLGVGGVLVRAQPAPQPPAHAPGATPHALRMLEAAALPGEVATPAPAPGPAPVATQAAHAFVPPPPPTDRARDVLVAGSILAGSLALLGVALYHRIRPNAALDNDTRRAIFDAICATPGLGVHEVSRAAGVSYSTATYHLERLVGAGMIVMTLDGNKLCYYKNGGAFTESERKILPILKNEEAARLFEAILDSPGTYRAALAERLGVTATTINWHLKRLRDAGLVDETRSGRSAYLYARVPAVRDVLASLAAKVGPSEPVLAARLQRYAGPPTDASGAA